MQIFANNEKLKGLEERLCAGRVIALEAEVTINKSETASRNFEVWGTLRAQLAQNCVATLEPLNTVVQTDISVRFSEDVQTGKGDCEIGLDDEHPPETIIDGMVDVGEAIVQHLALEIDPFPRSSGAPYLDVSSDEKDLKNKPFAELSGLRDKLKN